MGHGAGCAGLRKLWLAGSLLLEPTQNLPCLLLLGVPQILREDVPLKRAKEVARSWWEEVVLRPLAEILAPRSIPKLHHLCVRVLDCCRLTARILGKRKEEASRETTRLSTAILGRRGTIGRRPSSGKANNATTNSSDWVLERRFYYCNSTFSRTRGDVDGEVANSQPWRQRCESVCGLRKSILYFRR